MTQSQQRDSDIWSRALNFKTLALSPLDLWLGLLARATCLFAFLVVSSLILKVEGPDSREGWPGAGGAGNVVCPGADRGSGDEGL